jgi:hypothetical protein
MARPKSKQTTKSVRKSLVMEPSLYSYIGQYRERDNVLSDSEAMRLLMWEGLTVEGVAPSPDEQPRSAVSLTPLDDKQRDILDRLTGTE